MLEAFFLPKRFSKFLTAQQTERRSMCARLEVMNMRAQRQRRIEAGLFLIPFIIMTSKAE